MARVSRGTRTGVVAAAGLLAGTTLIGGCGGQETGPEAETGTATGTEAERDAGTGGGDGGDGGDGGEADEAAAEVVRTAHEKTVAAETARMTLKVRAAMGGQQQTLTGDGTVDLADGTSDLTVEAGGGERIEQRVVDETLYQRLPDQAREQLGVGKPWISVDLRELAGSDGTVGGVRVNDPVQGLDYARTLDDDATRVGTEEIGGVETTHYRVNVDVDELADGDTAEAERLRQQLGDSLPMHLWLDDQDRIRRQQFEIPLDGEAARSNSRARSQPPSREASEAKIRTVIEFSDFGTEVEVSPPPAEKTEDVTGKLARRAEGSSHG
ncbi:hypothetical protein IQ279_06735 [Streptomyces verrucosisporus]|uniref:hypothetical protein n=1 Tax=Streptomyces verrucosisporus TaxID=1695161 RepID=UPI0019D2A877|nr:hypothetical protein [Streptomyces verrucosisporus]MBN3929338.1 hypothetical protein [Streptomyces verrucosisporus]